MSNLWRGTFNTAHVVQAAVCLFSLFLFASPVPAQEAGASGKVTAAAELRSEITALEAQIKERKERIALLEARLAKLSGGKQDSVAPSNDNVRSITRRPESAPTINGSRYHVVYVLRDLKELEVMDRRLAEAGVSQRFKFVDESDSKYRIYVGAYAGPESAIRRQKALKDMLEPSPQVEEHL